MSKIEFIVSLLLKKTSKQTMINVNYSTVRCLDHNEALSRSKDHIGTYKYVAKCVICVYRFVHVSLRVV